MAPIEYIKAKAMLEQTLRWLPHLPAEALPRLRDAIDAELLRRDCCEHGISQWEYCRPCNAEYKRAAREHYGPDEGG